MEHRLIQGGGDEYLPFARSRIRALRALDNPYGSEQYEISGVSIKVRVEPGQEFIRIDGSNGGVLMDSGVVVLPTDPVIPDPGPQVYAPGVLYASNYVLDYDINFNVPARRTGWFVTARGASNQFSGMLSRSQVFTGEIPTDQTAASSFSSTPKLNNAAPPAWAMQTDDSMLKAKKDLATAYPASRFTGKCRMWIQALHGHTLYSRYGESGGVPTGAGKPYNNYLGSDVRGLTITPSRSSGASTDTQWSHDININTNTGVILDTTTGIHWLADIWPTAINFFPMTCSSAVKSWRRFLIVNPDTGSYDLSQEDREHLEAYILSESRPEILGVYTRSLGDTVPTNSMGYGWHWNWSGTAADIVDTHQLPLFSSGGIDYRAMESQHLRINVTRSGAGVFNVALQIIQAPRQWTIDRSHFVITAPYMSGYQSKVTPFHAWPATCAETTFYAFYRRDELVKCSASVDWINPTGYKYLSQPDYFGEMDLTRPYSISGYLMGSESGLWERILENPVGRYVTTITVDGEVTSGMELDLTRNLDRVYCYDRVLGADISGVIDRGGVQYVLPGYLTGDALINGHIVVKGSTRTAAYQGGVWYDANQYGKSFSASQNVDVGTRTDHDIYLLIIPSNNAEGVCRKRKKYKEEVVTRGYYHSTGTTTVNASWYQKLVIGKYTNLGSSIRAEYFPEEYDQLFRSGWIGGDPLTTTTENLSGTLRDEEHFFGIGGKHDMVFGGVTAFFDGSIEDVANPYSVLSGINIVKPVIIVQDPVTQPPIGVTALPTGSPNSKAIVGWA